MKSILSKHQFLQSEYAKLEHYPLLDPSNTDGMKVGDVYNYIKSMQFFLNEEINELLLELGNGDRAIHKPWSIRNSGLINAEFKTNDDVRNEAIDSLCFLMNILLAAGLSPDNIDEHYEVVFEKNRSRQNDQSY